MWTRYHTPDGLLGQFGGISSLFVCSNKLERCLPVFLRMKEIFSTAS
jgi:hypothetical protein